MSSHVTGVVYANGETIGSVEGDVFFDVTYFAQTFTLIGFMLLLTGFFILALRDFARGWFK